MRSTVSFTPVHGTWGFDGVPTPDEWTHPLSALSQFLRTQGLAARPPFYWSGGLDGLFWPWMRTSERKHLTWMTAGIALAERLRSLPLRDRTVFAHSHGGNVALYAAAQGVYIPVLITFMMPIREDMLEIVKKARPCLSTWIHVHSDTSDRVQWMGELLDHHLGIVRGAIWKVKGHVVEAADRNMQIPKVGHSALLTDPAKFKWWVDSGLIEIVKDTLTQRETS